MSKNGSFAARVAPPTVRSTYGADGRRASNGAGLRGDRAGPPRTRRTGRPQPTAHTSHPSRKFDSRILKPAPRLTFRPNVQNWLKQAFSSYFDHHSPRRAGHPWRRPLQPKGIVFSNLKPARTIQELPSPLEHASFYIVLCSEMSGTPRPACLSVKTELEPDCSIFKACSITH